MAMCFNQARNHCSPLKIYELSICLLKKKMIFRIDDTRIDQYIIPGKPGEIIKRYTDLTGNFTDSLLTAQNLVIITLLYPLLKIIHEFGHAYMVKKWGGEVHEMGVMFLVFMPIPYVDASSSLSFRDKWSRMAVGAAGILVELFVAALALLLWLIVEPGLVRAAAYNIMLIAGVSTLLFNGNPLLRFDAYYVLSDFLEIPNLGQRSTSFIGYLSKRYLLNIAEAESTVASLREGGWLLFYGIASFFYRMFISFRIILFIAGKFFFVGIIIAAWAFYGMLIAPIVRLLGVVLRDIQMKQRKGRLFLTIALPLGLLLIGIVAVPIPYFTRCEGVTWAPEESRVYAGADGFITDILADSGSRVLSGTPLIQSEAPHLAAQVRLLQARISEFDVRYQLSLKKTPTVSVLYKEELERLGAELDRARERQEALLLRSTAEGVFVLPRPGEIIGRFVRRGTPLAYLLNHDNTRVRVLVPQDSIERVRADTIEVDVRLVEEIGQVIPARIVREVPAASRILPSMVFSLEGGGEYAIDSRQQKNTQVLDRLFQFDIELAKFATDRVEERVYVRFKHHPVPLAWRWYAEVRRLFLSRFGV